MGPANAIAVTFLIPDFAVLWGGWVLDERVTPTMLFACGVILFGTTLATGAIGSRAMPAPRPGKRG